MFRTRILSAMAAFMFLGTLPIFAAPFYIIQKDTRYTQTSGAAPTTPDGFDFFATVTTPGSFDGGTTTVPVTNQVLPLANQGTQLQFGSGVIAGQTTFNATFPLGVYSFHLTDTANPANTADATVDDSTETFPIIPALTPSSFAALQSMDPTQALTVQFNTFTGAPPPFNGPLTFFAIVRQSNGSIVQFDGLQPDVGQDAIPANTLLAGEQYRYILFFSNDAVGTNTQLQLNSRTQGFFTPGAAAAAAPEPSTAWLGWAAIALLVGRFHRRSACR